MKLSNYILLVNSHSLEIPLADKSVHMCVTSPPYWGLRSYAGEDQMRVWGGDKYCEHEWEWSIRKGMSGGPSDKQESNVGSWHNPSKNAYCLSCGAWYGQLGLEPTINQYVSNLVEVFDEVWRVLRPDGTFWLNLGDSYNGSGGAGGDYNEGGLKEGQPRYPGRNVSELKPKDLCGIPWRVAFALQSRGWWLRSDIIWHKPNPMPNPVKDRPVTSHEYLFLFSKSRRYFYDVDAVRVPHKTINEEMRRKDFHNILNYSEKAPDQVGKTRTGRKRDEDFHPGGKNMRTVWEIPTRPYSGTHYAAYPPDLVKPTIKAGTSEYGVCPECGCPFERIVRLTKRVKSGGTPRATHGDLALLMQTHGITQHSRDGISQSEFETTGWRPTCDHYNDMYVNKVQRPRSERKRKQQDVYFSWWFKRIRKRPVELDWFSDERYEHLVPKKAIVLDPFVGSGTTLLVAREEGRLGVGLDVSKDYLVKDAKRRLALTSYQKMMDGIFDDSVEENFPLLHVVFGEEDE